MTKKQRIAELEEQFEELKRLLGLTPELQYRLDELAALQQMCDEVAEMQRRIDAFEVSKWNWPICAICPGRHYLPPAPLPPYKPSKITWGPDACTCGRTAVCPVHGGNISSTTTDTAVFASAGYFDALSSVSLLSQGERLGRRSPL